MDVYVQEGWYPYRLHFEDEDSLLPEGAAELHDRAFPRPPLLCVERSSPS